MRLLSKNDYAPLKQQAFARALKVSDNEYEQFAQAIKQLIADGRILIGAGSALTLPQMSKRVTGTLSVTSRGFGFVRPENPTAQGDLFIPPEAMLDAISGDKVVARVSERGRKGGERRLYGQIVEVLSRAQTHVVGNAFRDGQQWFVQPDGRAVTERIAIDDPSAKNVKAGDKVQVEILTYPTPELFGTGVVVEKFGRSGVSSVELKAIVSRFNLSEKFSRSALADTRRVVDGFDGQVKKLDGREDIRDTMIITIDPHDARDFDDAISIEKNKDGTWVLGVHIADVSNFVEEGTHLGDEAKDRATSVYLPGHVIPMLPELLSNGICSLQEGKDRFVKTAYVTLGKAGEVLGSRFANSLIRSTKRLTYEEADLILEGKTKGFSGKVVSMIKQMGELARIIQKRRLDDGMLTLEIPKAELIYDDKGHVVDARPESNTFSHTLIEMFMLEANEAAGRLLDGLQVPFLRRIHAEPDSLAMGEAGRIVKLCGYVIPQNIDRKGIQQLLNAAAGKPESFVINLAILKSMQRAEYSPAPMGHFALASRHYCHFTSPIRRYPDLQVHRLIQAYLEGRLTKNTAKDFPDYGQLEELGTHCSGRERNAEDAERELRKVKILQMLKKRVGQEMLGIVTGVTGFGMFVQLEKFLEEGLIRAEDIRLQKQSKSKVKHRGRRQKSPAKAAGGFAENCPYHIGQEIKVKLVDVNVAGRTMELVPVD